jgi:hypothetical protein
MPRIGNVDAGAALFVSRKTAETHLTRVYRKVGVRSRTQLAYLLLMHDLPGQLTRRRRRGGTQAPV